MLACMCVCMRVCVHVIVCACVRACVRVFVIQERYSSFESGIGAKIAKGEATLEDCEVWHVV